MNFFHKQSVISTTKKIWVVDDFKTTHIVLNRLFSQEQYNYDLKKYVINASFFSNFNEMKQYYQETKSKPDLLILDYEVPPTNSYEFLNTNEEFKEIPTIIITSHRDSKIEKAMKNFTSVRDYILKPFNLTEFMKKCESIIFKKQLV
jgi:response regulator RpfG family c-di-GMP phosphodiesterase